MPRLFAVVVLCALGRVASADVDTTWDGTYTNDDDGPTYLCPHPLSVTVSGGAYSFAWTISTGNAKPVRVGTITGSVRASGSASTKAKLLDPLPADALAAMKQLDEPLDKLTTAAGQMRLEFKKSVVHRSFDLSDGSCYASWVNDVPAPAAPAPAPAVKSATAPAKVGAAKNLKPPSPLAAGAKGPSPGDLAKKIGKPKPPAPTRAAKDKASASPAVKPDPAVKSDPVAKAEPAAKPDPAAKPKPAKQTNRWPQYGREMGRELMDYPQFEYKETWDYGVVRVDYAMNGRSLIWVLHRCDTRDGCNGKPGSGANWADIGWYQQD